jgi:CubicO group peptidase (beta-lactamase class C family)
MHPESTIQDVLKYHRQIDKQNWQFGGENMHYNFLHRSEFLPHAVVCRGGEISSLDAASSADLRLFAVESRYGRLPFETYIHTAPVNGIIIVHHGCILYEAYPRMRPLDKHALMSVGKVLVSTLIAILAARGQIDLSRPVESYLPSLCGSGWEHTPVEDVLDMASGIDAVEEEEGFTNPDHPYYQYEASLGWLPKTACTVDSTYAYVAGLKRKDPAGQHFEYTSVNTFLLSWLAEHMTGFPLNELISREIWTQIGAQGDGLLAQSAYGAPAAHAGFCAALRDVARFGLLFTPHARSMLPGIILPSGYVSTLQRGGRPELFHNGPSGAVMMRELHGERPSHNIHQWDYVMPDGDFFKGGYGGQGLYISPGRDLVVAYFGTPFDEMMQTHELQWITRQLIKTGLFD